MNTPNIQKLMFTAIPEMEGVQGAYFSRDEQGKLTVYVTDGLMGGDHALVTTEAAMCMSHTSKRYPLPPPGQRWLTDEPVEV